jgi:hypothetical protein
MPAPRPVIDLVAVSDRSVYALGEPIAFELTIANVSPASIVIGPDPPKMEIVLPGQEGVAETFAPGSGQIKLEPGERVTYTLVWDQRDSRGQQVPPGYYNPNIKVRDIQINGKAAGGFGVAVMVLIQYPQGAMEKTISPNQSRTINGLTIVLERIELTSTSAKFFAFTVPPDYQPPQGQDALVP